MSLSERLERLDARERRLLGIFAVVVAALLVLAVPVRLPGAACDRPCSPQELREATEGRGDVPSGGVAGGD